jgi:hypothetical protein
VDDISRQVLYQRLRNRVIEKLDIHCDLEFIACNYRGHPERRMPNNYVAAKSSILFQLLLINLLE